MAETEMVEVVIKMPKEKYDSICNMYGTFPTEMKEWGLEYIKNGTVLSKGHERLIGQPTDADIAETIGGQNNFADCIREAVATVFENAETIVEAEADTQNKEKENKEKDDITPYIMGATLLSVEDAKNLDEEILKADTDWWLGSHGFFPCYAACVYGVIGDVNDVGEVVGNNYGVRPALEISKFSLSYGYKIGDSVYFGGHSFTIISDTRALCDDVIGKCAFRKDSEAENANEYDASDIKRYVETWFKKAKEQNREGRDSEEEREI